MTKKHTTVSVQAGRKEFIKINAAKFDSRDTYHVILKWSWPQFAAWLLAVYVLLNLFFATVYSLGGRCIAEMSPGSFVDAFFFSVETLATVGYGHMYPESLYGHCVATVELVVGMFGMAVATGLIFVRFSRARARIAFSKSAVIYNFDGIPTLVIRVANMRHQPMAEAEFRIMALLSDETIEGEDVRRFRPLKLHCNHFIMFPVAFTLRHSIDQDSPLYGMTPARAREVNLRLVASIVCIDTVIPTPVQTQQEYSFDELMWNRRFVEMYTEDTYGKLTADYGRLNDTEAATGLLRTEQGSSLQGTSARE
jgi:inward rectifier potassium channel